MIVSRGIQITKLSNALGRTSILQNLKNGTSLVQKRNAGYSMYMYRKRPSIDATERKATMLGTFFWWWIFWHIFTDYHELIPAKTPDTKAWTDEELGIPPL